MLDIRQKPVMTFRLLSKHEISVCNIMSVSFYYCYTDYRAQCSLLCLRKKTLKKFFNRNITGKVINVEQRKETYIFTQWRLHHPLWLSTMGRAMCT